MTGTSHECQPEVDSLSHIDFNEAPGDFDSSSDGERRAWMVEAIQDVFGEAGVYVPEADCYLQLDLQGEELAWQWVERLVNEAGFDTYNSDNYFEVYPGGTEQS